MITYLAGIWLILVDCSACSFLFMLFWKIFWFGTEKSRWYTMLGAPANQGEWKKKIIMPITSSNFDWSVNYLILIVTLEEYEDETSDIFLVKLLKNDFKLP